MFRVSFMHMLFYLSSVPLSHPHGQHLPLASTRSPRVQLGGVAQVTLGCCRVGRYRRDNEQLCGVEPLCRCVVRSLPFSSANKKSPAAREVCCCAVVAACCTARRRAGLSARRPRGQAGLNPESICLFRDDRPSEGRTGGSSALNNTMMSTTATSKFSEIFVIDLQLLVVAGAARTGASQLRGVSRAEVRCNGPH